MHTLRQTEATNERVGYVSAKPQGLTRRVIKAVTASAEGAIQVTNCFSESMLRPIGCKLQGIVETSSINQVMNVASNAVRRNSRTLGCKVENEVVRLRQQLANSRKGTSSYNNSANLSYHSF